MNDKMDSLNFVWGNVGKKLEKLDKKRLLAIAQKNAEKYLFSISYDEFELLLDEIENGKFDIVKVKHYNETHLIFSEFQKFLTENSDMVSIGSLLVGQIDKSDRFAKLLTEE